MNHVTIHRHDVRWTGFTAVVRKAAVSVLKSEKSSFQRKLESSVMRKEIDSSVRWNDGVCLTIVLSDDDEVQALNAHYRGKDKPTNVLSFPDGDADETGAQQLGDIILSYDTIAREAAEQGKEFAHHLTHLVMHGVLHLLGYDHENAKDAEAMESREVALLKAMGIANPYES